MTDFFRNFPFCPSGIPGIPPGILLRPIRTTSFILLGTSTYYYELPGTCI